MKEHETIIDVMSWTTSSLCLCVLCWHIPCWPSIDKFVNNIVGKADYKCEKHAGSLPLLLDRMTQAAHKGHYKWRVHKIAAFTLLAIRESRHGWQKNPKSHDNHNLAMPFITATYSYSTPAKWNGGFWEHNFGRTFKSLLLIKLLRELLYDGNNTLEVMLFWPSAMSLWPQNSSAKISQYRLALTLVYYCLINHSKRCI